MTENSFFNDVYGSWKDKQIEKYEELVLELGELFNNCNRVLDVGIGKAWFWDYLKENSYEFDFIKGIDVSREATDPEKDYIDYVYIDEDEKNFNLRDDIGEDNFDLVIVFDSIHLIGYSDELPSLINEGGFILQSIPLKFKDSLKRYPCMKIVDEGNIGVSEIDRYLLQKK